MGGYEGFASVYDAWAADMTEDVDYYGWFDRRPFDDASRELVWVARKPA